MWMTLKRREQHSSGCTRHSHFAHIPFDRIDYIFSVHTRPTKNTLCQIDLSCVFRVIFLLFLVGMNFMRQAQAMDEMHMVDVQPANQWKCFALSNIDLNSIYKSMQQIYIQTENNDRIVLNEILVPHKWPLPLGKRGWYFREINSWLCEFHANDVKIQFKNSNTTDSQTYDL